jgi:hypothetical protein
MLQISLPCIIKQNESKNNACLAGVSRLGMEDPPIKRPTSKGQQNIVNLKSWLLQQIYYYYYYYCY